MGGLGPLLGPTWAVLGPKWSILDAIRAYVGGLGPGSGPKFACIGSGLAAKVVDLGSDQGEKWPKPERERDPSQRSGRKVAQTQAGTRSVTWHSRLRPPEAA